jgi:DNA-binding transcriptional LysR family regulator
MALNLHLLRLFAAVAERGSFSRAAGALRVSQPAVSKGVREFEAQVGTALLERSGGGVYPTEAGRRLLVQAHALFAAERAAEEELDGFRGLQCGSLAIGASTTIATYLLPPLLGEFSRRWPTIELHLTSANTRAIAESLVARALDIALVEGPTTEFNLRAESWRRDELVLIAAPDHRFARLSSLAVLAALEQEIFLIREPGSGTREVVAVALAKHKIRPRRTVEIGSTEAIKQMVASGFGVAIVSAAAAVDQIALGRLAVIRPPRFAVHRVLTQLTLRGRPMSAAATAFNLLLHEGSEQAAVTGKS